MNCWKSSKFDIIIKFFLDFLFIFSSKIQKFLKTEWINMEFYISSSKKS